MEDRTLSPNELSASIDDAIRWMTRHVHDMPPDAIMCAFSGLLHYDKAKAEELLELYEESPPSTLIYPKELLDLIRNVINIIRGDPLPLPPTTVGQKRHTCVEIPSTLYELYKIDMKRSNMALWNVIKEKMTQEDEEWLREGSGWGYTLTHQILIWTFCVKLGLRVHEAEQMLTTLREKLYNEVKYCQRKVCYDLYAERIAFLGFSGWDLGMLRKEFRYILDMQKHNGSWWHTHDDEWSTRCINDQDWYPQWRNQDVHEQIRYLARARQGHSTSLSIWALGLWYNYRT